MTNSKQKGNSFERNIANKLSERFKEYTGLEKSFRREVSSGSFFGGNNRVRTLTHDTEKASFGDIVVPNGFKFSIECKNYKTPPSFSSIVKQDVKQWDSWIEQAKSDADAAKLAMLLIIKYNNVSEIVIIENKIVGNEPILRYKKLYVYPFETWIKQDISMFFTI